MICEACGAIGVGDGVLVRPDILRSIADTLDARADADQPLTPVDMRSLATALQDLAIGPRTEIGATPPHLRSEDCVVSLRPRY